MEIAGDQKLHRKKGDNYEGDTFSGGALIDCFAQRVRGRQYRRRHCSRETSAAGGQLSTRPRLFLGRRPIRPSLHVRRGATGGSFELFGQSPIPHRELCASASDLGKGPFPSQERQCCAAIPWAYVVSSRGPKGGADEYPTRYERNL